MSTTFNTDEQYFIAYRQWAKDRNLIEGSTNPAQFVKLVEEFSEVDDDVKDAIGDAYVVLTILCAQRGIDIENVSCQPALHADFFKALLKGLGEIAAAIARNKDITIGVGRIKDLLHYYAYLNQIPLIECLDQAWLEIKDRKGKMVDGVFVKETDLGAA